MCQHATRQFTTVNFSAAMPIPGTDEFVLCALVHLSHWNCRTVVYHSQHFSNPPEVEDFHLVPFYVRDAEVASCPVLFVPK